MANTFNSVSFAGKLERLTTSQQSIETLSVWCIAHMNKAKEVVETWSRQFHSSPRKQRMAFLFLANDILQNSRRRGPEFVLEFWKVLPDCLRDIIDNGDEFARDDALRLISIWVERSVFGSRSQILKEDFLKRQLDNVDRDLRPAGFQMRPPGQSASDKIVSGFQDVYGSQLDEDAISSKCRKAIKFVDKVNKDTMVTRRKELKGQRAILSDCIEQLRVVRSSRQYLVTLLRDALQEQESKLDDLCELFQEAKERSKHARQLLLGTGSGQAIGKRSGNGSQTTTVGQSYKSGAGEQSASVVNTLQLPPAEKLEDNPKFGAKPSTSTSSAQMPAYVRSYASEGIVSSSMVHESSNDDPPKKMARIDDEDPSYVPPPPPLPPPSSPPPPPPYQVPQYTQISMPIIPRGPYGYSIIPPPPPLYPSFVPVGHPVGGSSLFARAPNAYYSYSAESDFYGRPPSLPAPYMGHYRN